MKKFTYLLFCLMLGIGLATAQTTSVTGIVISADDGEPIIGASVVVKGTSTGTVTDLDGNFTISNVPSSAKILVISYVGMQQQEVAIAPRVSVTLHSNSELLEDVVVIGYGVTKKAAFTGAATTLNAESIVNRTDANPIKALDGTVPGIQMNIGSGQPGAPARIFIRGRNSINSGTQPLYIVDGIPITSDVVGVRADEGQETSPLSTLSATDIETMTVLKDATATSIYGARAANGVIVITTKKGKAGRTRVNFSAKVGAQMMPSHKRTGYYPANASQYKELWTEANRNELEARGDNSYINAYLGMFGMAATEENLYEITELLMENYNRSSNTNWLDEVTRTGLTQEYSVDVQGGSTDPKGVKYFLSLSYLNDEAIILGKDLKRYSFRFNFDQSPSKLVTIGLNSNFTFTETNMGAGGGYFTDQVTQAFMLSPTNAVKDENGDWNFDTSTGYNPVAIRSEKGDKSLAKQYRALISPYLQLNFTPDLTFMSRGGADIYIIDEFGFWSFLNPQGADYNGLGENNQTIRSLLSLTNTLNYIKQFNKAHNLNVLLGQEMQYTHLKEAYLAATNYPVDYLPQVANAAVPGNADTYINRVALASFFANVQYDYLSKYYLSASFRMDGSSRFGSNNRWAPFWSLGAKYRISNEAFFENTTDWLDNLTLRMSYGTSGNQEVGGIERAAWYASQNLYEFGYNYNGMPGSGHKQFGNPDLKWEKTNKFNVGFDISLFRKLNIEFDYYNHKTTDMVFAIPTSMVTGLSSYYKNVGELSNKGVEATINAQIINTKDFSWSATLTAAHNKNEVLKLSTDNPIETATQITEVGKPLYQFKMKEWAGVDPQTGQGTWYLNESGDEITTNYNAAAKRYVGTANPKMLGSFSSTFTYRDFDFSFQLNYSLGGKIYGNHLRYDEHIGGSFGDNFTEYVYENRWQKPGDNALVPKLMAFSNSYDNNASTRFLMDGDYLKIRSLTLGYTVPNVLLSKASISRLRVYVQSDNIYSFFRSNYRGFDASGVDADGVQWWNFPLPRNVVFGVNLSF